MMMMTMMMTYIYRVHGLYGKAATILTCALDPDKWILGEYVGMSDSNVCSWFGAPNCSVEAREVAPASVRPGYSPCCVCE